MCFNCVSLVVQCRRNSSFQPSLPLSHSLSPPFPPPPPPSPGLFACYARSFSSHICLRASLCPPSLVVFQTDRIKWLRAVSRICRSIDLVGILRSVGQPLPGSFCAFGTGCTTDACWCVISTRSTQPFHTVGHQSQFFLSCASASNGDYLRQSESRAVVLELY